MTQLEQNSLALQSAVATRMGLLRNVAFRCLGNRDDAEDAVQDAILHAYRKLGQFRGEAAISTWLGRIVINSAHMMRRRAAGHVRISNESEETLLENLTDDTPHVDDVLHERAQYAWFEKALRALTPRLRQAVHCRLAGMSDRQMADAMGCPIGTAKARLARAKARLVERAQKAGMA